MLYKHALRNCAIPLITYLGLQFGGLIGGIVVIEMVFNWPGLGTLAFDAISGRDYPVLQGTVTVLAAVIVLVNLIVDIAYGIVDPRIHALSPMQTTTTTVAPRPPSRAALPLAGVRAGRLPDRRHDPPGAGLGLAVPRRRRIHGPGRPPDRALRQRGPPFGTDPLGRDVLARVIVGGKISLLVGFASVLGGALLGIIMGLISGYYRGFWDMIVMRFADVQLALPFILVAITFIAILGGGLFNVIFFAIISQWVQYARLVRARCWRCANASSCWPRAPSACATWP